MWFMSLCGLDMLLRPDGLAGSKPDGGLKDVFFCCLFLYLWLNYVSSQAADSSREANIFIV